MCDRKLFSTTEVRRQNRNRVYRQLTATWEPITKQDLATQLSMSLPTLSQNLNELGEMGLIDRSETTSSTGGRRPRLIIPLADARFAIGAEVTSRDSRIPLRLEKEDTLLLCSDGVSDTLSKKQLREALALPPQAACDRLEEDILAAGLPNQDNYTAIIMRYHGEGEDT